MTTTIQDAARQAGKLATGADLKTAQPGAKLRFGGGLYLLVSGAGTKSWQVHYHVGGKHRATIVGRWPAMTAEEAQCKRDILHFSKPRIDPRRITAAAIADQALIKAFTQWKPSKGAQRFVDEAFVRAFGAWRATR